MMNAKAIRLLLTLCLISMNFNHALARREIISLDKDWKFHFGHSYNIKKDFYFGDSTRLQLAKLEPDPYGTHSIEGTILKFDDQDWQKVNIPHDWSVALPYDADQVPEMGSRYGYKPVDRAYPETSIGWYRKRFEVSEGDEGKIITLAFDGVFKDSTVWVNGFHIGRHWSGHTGFEYDISDYLRYGETNIIAVRVDASLHEGWFYEGAGIIKEVKLIKTDPLHIEFVGPYITTTQEDGKAVVEVKTKVLNEHFDARSAGLTLEIIDQGGKVIATDSSAVREIQARAEHNFAQTLRVENPALWSVEAPNRYTLLAQVQSGGKTVDYYRTRFGIRSLKFDPDRGFFLNGERVQIKGVCIHQNFAGVGAAIPRAMHYYRLKLLKEMGVNAIRSHYPFSKSMLEAADSMGVMVMDETRAAGSTGEALGQLEWMVTNHRNHPSIILWSMANEEGGTQRDIIGRRYMKKMVDLTHRLDPGRMVTAGVNAWGAKVDFGFSQELDVMGFNYSLGFIDEYHKNHPQQPIVGTELSNVLVARGVYVPSDSDGGPGLDFELKDGVGGYYTPEGVLLQPATREGRLFPANTIERNATAYEAWQFYADRKYLAGGFLWTGFDYNGETWPISFPNNSSQFGAMDMAGFPKDIYYYYQSWWTDKPVLHIAQHWNWHGQEGKDIDVLVHSNADRVSLYVNGENQGSKYMPRNGYLQWQVRYVPGVLKAVGYRGNKIVSEQVVNTAGAPDQIRLTPDRTVLAADGQDVAMVRVEVLDKSGNIVPFADNQVFFEVSGEAGVLGVGNGNPASYEPDAASERRAFNGKALVVIQAGEEVGTATLTAHSKGLRPTAIELDIKLACCEPR